MRIQRQEGRIIFLTSYVMRGILCVTLDGKILGRWVFVVYVTRWWLVLLKEWVEGRVSVTKGMGLPEVLGTSMNSVLPFQLSITSPNHMRVKVTSRA